MWFSNFDINTFWNSPTISTIFPFFPRVGLHQFGRRHAAPLKLRAALRRGRGQLGHRPRGLADAQQRQLPHGQAGQHQHHLQVGKRLGSGWRQFAAGKAEMSWNVMNERKFGNEEENWRRQQIEIITDHVLFESHPGPPPSPPWWRSSGELEEVPYRRDWSSKLQESKYG